MARNRKQLGFRLIGILKLGRALLHLVLKGRMRSFKPGGHDVELIAQRFKLVSVRIEIRWLRSPRPMRSAPDVSALIGRTTRKCGEAEGEKEQNCGSRDRGVQRGVSLPQRLLNKYLPVRVQLANIAGPLWVDRVG